jgi:hypothetical protein
MKIQDRIVAVAEEFEGLVEIKSNTDWDDLSTKGKDPHAETFKSMLKRAGHNDGWPYCMSFCEGIWVTAYSDAKASAKVIAKIRELLSPSVMNSYQKCRESGLISREPHRGAIGFMQKGKTWQGHAFLVSDVDAGWIRTIEANTSPGPDQNERDGGIGLGGVWRKKRSTSFVEKSGLWLRGFINPIEPK